MAEHNPHVVAPKFTFNTFLTAVLAGGIAGTSIDFALFPIDSIKTRLQATSNKIDYVKQAETVSKFKGLASAMTASFPCAATFWMSYEFSKYFLHSTPLLNNNLNVHVQHILASSMAETCQAMVRCPFEVVK